MIRPTAVALLSLLLLAATAPDYRHDQLPDARTEADARALMEDIRCLVCQGQSIADSDADIAGDMRALIRGEMARGRSADEVKAWLVARYGDYVTYDPPLSWASAPLWLSPLAIMAVGLIVALRVFRRRR